MFIYNMVQNLFNNYLASLLTILIICSNLNLSFSQNVADNSIRAKSLKISLITNPDPLYIFHSETINAFMPSLIIDNRNKNQIEIGLLNLAVGRGQEDSGRYYFGTVSYLNVNAFIRYNYIFNKNSNKKRKLLIGNALSISNNYQKHQSAGNSNFSYYSINWFKPTYFLIPGGNLFLSGKLFINLELFLPVLSFSFISSRYNSPNLPPFQINSDFNSFESFNMEYTILSLGFGIRL